MNILHYDGVDYEFPFNQSLGGGVYVKTWGDEATGTNYRLVYYLNERWGRQIELKPVNSPVPSIEEFL